MMSEPLKITRNGKILEVTLDRPKANAIDNATSRAMGELFSEFRDDPDLRVAILTGEGDRFFSAGWDLNAAAEGDALEGEYGVGGFGGLTEHHDLNKPVIAAVNGMAVGGGFELALACDLIVAADHAQFFLPEIFVGLIADAATLRLPKRLPYYIAQEMLLTGRRMGAEEAQRWGMVNAVIPREQLMDKAREFATIIIQAAPLSIAAVKEVTRATSSLTVAESYELLHSGKLETYTKMLHSEDALEGPRAFAEKRKPKWKGK
ncbi:MAG TPA: carnitinyl-CoA dehydratase [Anaerolineales bacterium]|nr:carnitinyl-CoA dehydratase [Anaerolineales bacterium]